MALSPGTRLGHYDVTTLLGEGGMGQVWQATDTQLNRDVALKILPDAFAAAPDRLARFKREAQILATLNHPNIVTIHSVEEANGFRFLTMELVEGDSLDQTIPKDGLPLERFLELAAPLTSGLAAAHAKGITHRDLKPANVMVGNDGRVKVLDFGLAKGVEGARGARGENPADMPTITATATRAGVILGTASYMSPEQIEGKPVDARSDMFSLGILLYEMATGRRPFLGDSSISVMSSILKDAPAPVRTLRAEVPSAVADLVARCLEKRPEDRFANGAAVHAALTATGLEPRAQGPEPRTRSPEARRPFVGRDAERAELDGLLDRISGGQGGSFVLLGGEPGVGKTRLAEECLMDARERGHSTLTGHCYEEGAAPFIPLVEMLERLAVTLPLARLREALGDYAPEIARLAPALRHRLAGLPEPTELPPEMRRRYLFNGLLELLRNLCKDGPYVLFFDDLHWADDASLALLEHVAPHLSELPVVMVGTYRDVELEVGKPFERTLATLVRQRLATRLTVKRLPEASVGELLAALGGGTPLPPLVSAIFRETEGNPFFVEEVFAHLSEEGKLFDADGRWKADLKIDELEVPEGVRLVIGRRLERLSEGTPKVLTTAALVGRRFEVAVVEAVPAWDEDQVLEAIEEAEAAKLVRPEEDARTVSYGFTHELIRQTLLGSLSLPRRQRLHLRIAGAIEATHPDRLEERAAELGRHLYLAGGVADEEKTVKYLDLAGRQALETGAYEEALQCCEDALSLLNEETELVAERADLLFRRALAKKGVGRRDGIEVDLRAAFELHEQLGRRDEISDVCAELAYFLVWASRPDEVEELVSRALSAVGEGDSPARCRLLSRLGFIHGILGHAKSTLTAADETLGMATRLGIPRLSAVVWTDRVTDLIHAGQIDSLVQEANGAFEIQQSAGVKFDLSHTQLIAIMGWFAAARFDRLADDRLADYEKLAQQVGYNGQLGFIELFGAARRAVQGDLQVSGGLRRAIAYFEKQGGAMSAEAVALSGLLEAWQGRAEESVRTFAQLPLGKVIPVWRGWAASHQLLAMAYRGDPATLGFLDSHRSWLPTAGEPNRAGTWLLLPAVVEALSMLGDRSRAAELYPLVPELLQTGAVVTFSAGLGLVEKTAGIAAVAGERWPDAEAHFERALGQAEDIPHRIDQADVRRWWAWMLLDRNAPGDRDRARELLGQARAIFEEIGMPLHVKIVSEMQGR